MDGVPSIINNLTFTCINEEEHIHSAGILYGDDPLKHSFPSFIALIALAQIASHAIYFLLKPLRQPRFVCSLLGGIFLGPTVLGHNKRYLSLMFTGRDRILLDVTSNLGLTYFLFLTMVKMDAPMTLRTSKIGLGIGFVNIILPALVSFILYGLAPQVLNAMNGKAPVMACSFILTHFPNVVPVLDELNLLSSDVGQIALTSSAVNEVLSWASLPIAMVLQNGELREGFFILLSVLVLIILFFPVRLTLLRVASRTPEGRPVSEVYISIILLGTLHSLFITNSVGLVFLGTMLFGLAIPKGPPLGTTLVDKSEIFTMEILLPLFYLNVGLHTDIYSIQDWKGTLIALALSAFVTLFKFIGAFLPAAVYYKLRIRQASMLGLLLNVRGVAELIFLRRWRERKVLDDQSYTVMVLANLVITALSVPLLDILKHQDRMSILPTRDSELIQKSLHSSELRVVSCVHGEENVHSIITLLEASNPTPFSPICAYVVHLVELVGRAVPLVVPYGKHKKMHRTKSTDHIMRAFNNYSRSSDGTVTVKPFTIIAPYKSMHENIGNLARGQAAHLIVVPFQKRQQDDVREVTYLRSLNPNIQASAPCTVGILVDNGFHHRARYSNSLFNVAVIFLGGPDDREALAYGTRASGREGIHITVIRILLNSLCANNDHEDQKKLDDEVIKEFKIKNANNMSAVHCEVEAEDNVHVVNIVKSLELNYDLVILGRRPGSRPIFREEMLSFTEHPELGVIGDMLASEDLCGGETSILVMQHRSYS
ncbi:hypothetical protein CDL15_Pgr022495 [Punica granatum]|uniref:Uncharacterized protein n=1 Tax=Punica granatum TaxID=22663 RepID=A0A218XR19_PUNGR|nr:hypothetical protein CDL15_Pgr022495 [Punica granatum]PKI31804.1 hypothetical protein CRG98_047807 [Punica granatum]